MQTWCSTLHVLARQRKAGSSTCKVQVKIQWRLLQCASPVCVSDTTPQGECMQSTYHLTPTMTSLWSKRGKFVPLPRDVKDSISAKLSQVIPIECILDAQWNRYNNTKIVWVWACCYIEVLLSETKCVVPFRIRCLPLLCPPSLFPISTFWSLVHACCCIKNSVSDTCRLKLSVGYLLNN